MLTSFNQVYSLTSFRGPNIALKILSSLPKNRILKNCIARILNLSQLGTRMEYSIVILQNYKTCLLKFRSYENLNHRNLVRDILV